MALSILQNEDVDIIPLNNPLVKIILGKTNNKKFRLGVEQNNEHTFTFYATRGYKCAAEPCQYKFWRLKDSLLNQICAAYDSPRLNLKSKVFFSKIKTRGDYTKEGLAAATIQFSEQHLAEIGGIHIVRFSLEGKQYLLKSFQKLDYNPIKLTEIGKLVYRPDALLMYRNYDI